MAGARWTDLRSRVLAAIEAAARRFAVGHWTAWRWAQAARKEKPREAIAKPPDGVMPAKLSGPMHGGSAPRIHGKAKAATARACI